jgi:hypothetical protein
VCYIDVVLYILLLCVILLYNLPILEALVVKINYNKKIKTLIFVGYAPYIHLLIDEYNGHVSDAGRL